MDTKVKRFAKWFRFGLAVIFCLFAAQPTASAQGWRWLNPLPLGDLLTAVWSDSESDIFAVGYSGAIVHYDGTSWDKMASGTNKVLSAIWGTSKSDVFAAGADGTILHYDGEIWQHWQSGTEKTLLAIWGDQSGHVFFSGYGGTILRYDGTSLSKMESGTDNTLYSIWGKSAAEVYAAGAGEIVLQYNGASWETMHQGSTSYAFKGIWGTSEANLFAAGDRGIFHFDGSSWSIMDTGGEKGFIGILGHDADNVYALVDSHNLYHYDGSAWTQVSAPDYTNYYTGMWKNGPGSFLLSGQGIFEYDGKDFSTRVALNGSTFCDVWGSSPTNVYVVGCQGKILQKSGAQWNILQDGKNYCLRGIWGSSASAVFTVGSGGTILFFNGREWMVMDSGSEKNLSAVWGSSPTDVFAIGEDGTILHFDGSSWATMESGTTYDLKGIWGSSSNDIYVAGYHWYYDGGTVITNPGAGDGSWWVGGGSGTVITFPGIGDETWVIDGGGGTVITFPGVGDGSWAVVDSAKNDFNATESGPINALSVTSVILHYDGSNWTRVYWDNNYYENIWGSSSKDVFAVGPRKIAHFDGASWNIVNSSERYEQLYAIWGTSGKDIYAMGNKTMHFDGTQWQRMPYFTRKRILGMWGNTESGLYAVGYGGTILHFGGESLPEALPSQSATVALTDMSSDSPDPAELRRQYNLSDRFTPKSYVQTFSATISPSGALALMRFKMNGLSGTISDLSLQKLLNDGESLSFKDYADGLVSNTDGAWWITEEDGVYLASSSTLASDRFYYVNFAVKDNGAYDQDDRLGYIRDPMVLGSTNQTNSSASGGGGGCFIATAAYGSIMEPHVRILRSFRDRFLLTCAWGRAFVRTYYEEAPPYADLIAKNAFLRYSAQICLFPLVLFASAAMKIGLWSTIVSTTALFAGIAIGLLFFLRRRAAVQHPV